jgi:hypothetical protein
MAQTWQHIGMCAAGNHSIRSAGAEQADHVLRRASCRALECHDPEHLRSTPAASRNGSETETETETHTSQAMDDMRDPDRATNDR